MAFGTISAVFFFSIDKMSLNDATYSRNKGRSAPYNHIVSHIHRPFKATIEYSATYKDGVPPPSKAHVVSGQVQPTVVREVRQV